MEVHTISQYESELQFILIVVSVFSATDWFDVAHRGMLVNIAVPLAVTVPVEVPFVSNDAEMLHDFEPLVA